MASARTQGFSSASAARATSGRLGGSSSPSDSTPNCRTSVSSSPSAASTRAATAGWVGSRSPSASTARRRSATLPCSSVTSNSLTSSSATGDVSAAAISAWVASPIVMSSRPTSISERDSISSSNPGLTAGSSCGSGGPSPSCVGSVISRYLRLAARSIAGDRGRLRALAGYWSEYRRRVAGPRRRARTSGAGAVRRWRS